jgi:hypothetical protein
VPIIPWRCAHGDTPVVTLDCAEEIGLASADTNSVLITGRGVIRSFGPSPATLNGAKVAVTVTVIFQPDKGEQIVLEGEQVITLSGKPRTITGISFGIYSCYGHEDWVEQGFWETGERETSRRLDHLEERLKKLESERGS